MPHSTKAAWIKSESPRDPDLDQYPRGTKGKALRVARAEFAEGEAEILDADAVAVLEQVGAVEAPFPIADPLDPDPTFRLQAVEHDAFRLDPELANFRRDPPVPALVVLRHADPVARILPDIDRHARHDEERVA